MVDAPHLLLGLVGTGIGPSLTPALHEEEGRHHGLRVHYQRVDLAGEPDTVAALPGLVRALRTIGFAGFNVTYPCKQAILPLLDDLSDEAGAIGAVNTVVVRDGRLVGHNTDASGWALGLRRALPRADLSRVVLLGTGGAGAAIAHAAMGLGAGELVLVDREPGRARALADAVAHRFPAGCIRAESDVAAALRGATGLVHATPTGMAKQPGLPLPAELLHPGLWVSEIVYFPLETALLQAARARGCAVADGGGMAAGQAIGAFGLFTGREPDAARMEAHLRSMLARRRREEALQEAAA